MLGLLLVSSASLGWGASDENLVLQCTTKPAVLLDGAKAQLVPYDTPQEHRLEVVGDKVLRNSGGKTSTLEISKTTSYDLWAEAFFGSGNNVNRDALHLFRLKEVFVFQLYSTIGETIYVEAGTCTKF
jgi:hypothetical protein